jgi:hypothetical protein
MQNRRWISASLLVAGAAVGVIAQGFAETASGELWDLKTERKIIAPGGMVMSMPPTAQEACIKPGDLPASIDERFGCRRTDLMTSPTTASWKETCVGPPARGEHDAPGQRQACWPSLHIAMKSPALFVGRALPWIALA